MVKMQETIICENFYLGLAKFVTMFGTAGNTDYTFDMTDCKDEAILIVDTTYSAVDIVLEIEAGDYPTKSKGYSYDLAARDKFYISISGGEVMQSDGKVHFRVSGLTDSNNLCLAVLKKRMVTNH